MFATANGTVWRNSMDAFTNVPSNGKIAMRFEDDSPDRLIGVALLTENDDVLLATRQGQAIRFEATVVREFQSRTATAVPALTLQGGPEWIPPSILHRAAAPPEGRGASWRFA